MRNNDQDNQDELFLLKKSFLDKNKNLLENEVLNYDLVSVRTHEVLIPKNTTLNFQDLEKLPLESLLEIKIKHKEKDKKLTS